MDKITLHINENQLSISDTIDFRYIAAMYDTVVHTPELQW